MSRIGNRILKVDDSIQVELLPENIVKITGKKGSLSKQFDKNIKISFNNNELTTTRSNNIKSNKQLHGTTNSLLQGMIEGVSKGFIKELQIFGVGYKAKLVGQNLILNLGFSHDIKYGHPAGVTIEVPSPTSIKVSGIDKQLVGQTAAIIRDFKKPEPYKGKGIRYKNENIIRKEGKSAGK